MGMTVKQLKDGICRIEEMNAVIIFDMPVCVNEQYLESIAIEFDDDGDPFMNLLLEIKNR